MSGSLCLIHPPIFHQILPTTFNSIHLPSVTASKSVLLLYNTAPYVDGELLSTIQIHLATPAVRLRTLTWLPYLEPVPFMDFVFLLTLWMPDSLQKAMWIIEYCFFFPLVIMLVIGLLYIIHSSTSLSSFLHPPPSLRWWRRRTCFTWSRSTRRTGRSLVSDLSVF